MAYEGVDGLTGRSGLGVAVSEDGITWRKRPGEALLEPSPAGFDDGSVEGPALAVDEESGRLSVWYAGRAFRSESGASGIGLAEFGYGPGANGSK